MIHIPRCALTLLVFALLCRTASPEAMIQYTVPEEGAVSLAIYDAGGRLVRTLLTGAPRLPGDYTEPWDGRDRYGNALPAGTCTWKLLQTAGLQAEFITQLGQNPDPVWEKGVCNHNSPESCAVDATGLYRIGGFDEGAHFGVKTDLNGRYLWTTDRGKEDPWCNMGAALALANGRLFELVHNGTVYVYDAQSGRVLAGGGGTKAWNLRWPGDGPAAGSGNAAQESLRSYAQSMDLDADPKNNLLVASYRKHDAIQWFDAKDGRPVDKATGIPAPTGIAVAGDGTVLVISRGAVVALSRENKTPKVVIPADRLQNPWRISVNPKTNDIFVAENSDCRPPRSDASGQRRTRDRDISTGVMQDPAGTEPGADTIVADRTRHHQVKCFARSGKLKKTYGAPAGRCDGVYVPTDLRCITDIAAGPEGGFVITEGRHTPPRRTARFDASGKLLREWYGAQEYGVLGSPEPDDPTHVWHHANGPTAGMVRCRVDYEKKTWSVVETYYDTFLANGLWGGSGSPLWSVGRHSPDPDHEIGSQAMPRNIVGMTHGCIIWADASDEEVAQPTVWTDDGLYVDELLTNQADGQNEVLYGVSNANEFAFANLYTHPNTGEVLMFSTSSAGGSPIYRITGWDRLAARRRQAHPRATGPSGRAQGLRPHRRILQQPHASRGACSSPG